MLRAATGCNLSLQPSTSYRSLNMMLPCTAVSSAAARSR